MELNSQLGNANYKIDLLNKSINTHEQKADENVPRETEKVDTNSPLE